jgi:hypothetical protein
MPQVFLIAALLTARVERLPVYSSISPADTCPAATFQVMNSLMTADSLGVGTSSDSRDSSRIDTLTTERDESAPDISSVILSYHVTCLFASPDSVILRIRSKWAGRIEPGNDPAFVAETSSTLGYADIVKRSGRWKFAGPFAASSVSPAAALRRFASSLDAKSSRALARLAATHR